jgi:hypothetical protein
MFIKEISLLYGSLQESYHPLLFHSVFPVAFSEILLYFSVDVKIKYGFNSNSEKSRNRAEKRTSHMKYELYINIFSDI